MFGFVEKTIRHSSWNDINYKVTSTERSVLLVEGFWRELKLSDRDRVHSAQGNSDDLLTLEVYEVIFAHQQRPASNQQLIQNRIPDTNVLNTILNDDLLSYLSVISTSFSFSLFQWSILWLDIKSTSIWLNRHRSNSAAQRTEAV